VKLLFNIKNNDFSDSYNIILKGSNFGNGEYYRYTLLSLLLYSEQTAKYLIEYGYKNQKSLNLLYAIGYPWITLTDYLDNHDYYERKNDNQNKVNDLMIESIIIKKNESKSKNNINCANYKTYYEAILKKQNYVDLDSFLLKKFNIQNLLQYHDDMFDAFIH